MRLFLRDAAFLEAGQNISRKQNTGFGETDSVFTNMLTPRDNSRVTQTLHQATPAVEAFAYFPPRTMARKQGHP